ncbi:methionine import ATP-binding protein MetN [Catenovulum agarivorans DS-2]|uniref:Methionine import ATP-binding protein MetN n=1 Tax=Catenovulum agarivorans DS-2 TaxID=1328313 RepID=W7QFB4_9ALTE|nr:ATP-binding cassette domain-containing protein [Catenovulum agarivorans]EWH11594.1 methionine import ATP-binding protein MetN [Catenovulum agarivorans DS-2]
MSLDVKHFYLGFADLSLFEDAQLSIAEGEIVCLSTGVLDGGTSFLKACAGIVPYQSGTLLVDGEEISHMPADKIFRKVAYCYESGGLVSLFTVYNNIALPLKYHRNFDNDFVAKRITSVAELLGIASILEYDVHQLNDVQLRLVNLARALVIRPRLLLADELQSGMSPAMREQILAILKDYCNQTRASLLMTTTAGDSHSIADRVYRIENKKIILESP